MRTRWLFRGVSTNSYPPFSLLNQMILPLMI